MDTYESASAPRKGLPAPDARGRRSARLLVAGSLLLLVLWTARSYLAALGWSVVIAIAIWPLYRRLGGARPRRRRGLAPLLATLATAVVVAVPVLIALGEIGREGGAVIGLIEQAQQGGLKVPDWVKGLPFIGEQLGDPQFVADRLKGLNTEDLTGWVSSLGGALSYRLILALLTFMALFLLLRDGAAIGDRLLAVAGGWLGQPGERLMHKMVIAVRGVVNGTVIVAIAEGVLIGIGYWLAGVPHAVLFSLLTAAFAMLPLGAWFAFSAAALILLLSGGQVLAAAAVFGWGAFVMLAGDNFVQPALIGGAARLPLLAVLVGILGGLETFGLVGLFMGPVLMAAFLTVWREWIGGGTPEGDESA